MKSLLKFLPVCRWLAVVLAVAGRSWTSFAQDNLRVPAAFRDHVARLQAGLPDGFTVVVQPPFVVIGDEPAAVVQRRATNTVRWAVERLKREYFPRDPAEIIDIWLFRDRASYTNHSVQLFNLNPVSPFGFFAADQQALIMNISTGGGTLVHEIVHVYLRENFPACPPWFNEGLASLYEAAADKDGHIRGLINWRLKGLEQSIREGKTIPFQQLTAMTETEFYGGSNGTDYSAYYAQSRYLCYYLQEKGLLQKYYREFAAGVKVDPTGYETLRRVLQVKDMVAFKKQWEDWVLHLRTP